jgi:hypothetical protein
MRGWLWLPLIFIASVASADSLTLESLSTPSHPGVVTIDFDGPGTSRFDYFEDGFRLHAGDHYHLDSGELAFDNFGGFSASERLDLFGDPFDFLSFDVTSLVLTLGTAGPGDVAYVTSSDGGFAEITKTGTMSLMGQLWRNVSWVEFWISDPNFDFPDCPRCAQGGLDALHIDNLREQPTTRSVPEPSSSLLLAIGLVGIGFGRALRRTRPEPPMSVS